MGAEIANLMLDVMRARIGRRFTKGALAPRAPLRVTLRAPCAPLTGSPTARHGARVRPSGRGRCTISAWVAAAFIERIAMTEGEPVSPGSPPTDQ